MINNPDYFKNKYRTPTNRSQSWDYAGSGTYFITICTKDKVKWFGEIQDDQMKLSGIGKIIEEEWLQTAKLREYAYLDQYVIMPNHFHAIIAIDAFDLLNGSVQLPDPLRPPETSQRDVSTMGIPKLQKHSLGSIINQFKGACTKRILKFEPNFSWQPRYHDKIIRNEKQLSGIRKYIIANPYNWAKDDNFL